MYTDEEFGVLPSAPPPSYDDVVAAGSSVVVTPSPIPTPLSDVPSFPIPSVNTTARPPQWTESQTGQRRVSSQQQMHSQTSRQYTRTSLQNVRSPMSSRPRQQQQVHFLEKLARFNMAGIMLNGVTLPSIDAQLDSEAHLSNRRTLQKMASRRKQIKCICSWMWCCGFTILFFLVALPVAMLLTGIFAFNSCPYREKIIIISLILISVAYFAALMIRLFNSCLSCCKLGDMCNTGKSLYWSACIGIMEGCFIVCMIITAVVVLLGTWFVLEARPNTTNLSHIDYCNSGVHQAAIIMISMTYVLSFGLFVYLAIAAVTYYFYQHELGLDTKKRKRRQPQRNHADTLY